MSQNLRQNLKIVYSPNCIVILCSYNNEYMTHKTSYKRHGQIIFSENEFEASCIQLVPQAFKRTSLQQGCTCSTGLHPLPSKRWNMCPGGPPVHSNILSPQFPILPGFHSHAVRFQPPGCRAPTKPRCKRPTNTQAHLQKPRHESETSLSKEILGDGMVPFIYDRYMLGTFE